jgi:hypothetical protein
MINKRIFGSALDGKVKEELERRQNLTQNEDNELESIQNNQYNPEFSLSERTPFVRMWTSLKFIQRELLEELLYTIEIDEANPSLADSAANSYQRQNPTTEKKPVLDENGKLIKYQFYDPEVRERVDYAKQTYIVGDYNYQESYGTSEGSQSNLEIFSAAQDDETRIAKAAFPRQLKDNPLLKPQAGITSVSSETQEFLGAIKSTTINFKVHNFYDFDRIYNRYFLKPGATIFVDFGWSDITSLYNPDDLINSNDIIKYLYDDDTGQISQNPDKLEIIQGTVIDYSAKILENGSVDCSLTIQSTNSTLLNQQADDTTHRQMQDILSNGVRYLGIIPTLKDDSVSDEENENLQKFLLTPNKTRDFGSVFIYEENLKNKAKKILSSGDLTPIGNPVRTGVYISNLDADDVYISLGFFEDIIMSERFGFGKNIEEIKSGKNLNVRMDSSNSFTSFSNTFIKRQQNLQDADASPSFIIPSKWGDDVRKPEESETSLGSYNFQTGKFPEDVYDNSSSHTEQDKEMKRLPVRELFINCETILTAFKTEDNTHGVINEILRQVNEDSDNLFNLTLVGGGEGVGNELRIIDNHKLETLEQILKSGGVADNTPQYFKDMFTFNVMSPNSIIKEYNIDFRLPTSEIGTMYAIQAMGNENKLFPASDVIDNTVAINSLDENALSMIYLPDMGAYRAEQLSNFDQKEGDLFNVYQYIDNITSTDVYTVEAKTTNVNITTPLPFSTNAEYETFLKPVDEDVVNNISDDGESYINNNKKLIEDGHRVVESLDAYYKKQSTKEEKVSIVDRPNLLPFTISITIYGISSIQPGDTFRVDYLPEIYQKNTFCQTMHVKHNINSDGWFTTLEAQFRPLPAVKKSHYTETKLNSAYLTPAYLAEYYNLDSIPSSTGAQTELFTTDWTRGRPLDQIEKISSYRTRNELPIFTFINYITKLEPVETPNLENLTVFSFEISDGWITRWGDNTWVGSYNYKIPRAFVEKSKREFLSDGHWYGFDEVEYPEIKGAINDDFYYYPFPVQMKEANKKYYFIVNESGASTSVFFADELSIKYHQIKKFDKPLVKSVDENANRKAAAKKRNQQKGVDLQKAFPSGKVGACFLTGTQVTLQNGVTKNIEDIQVGDLVLSYNKNTFELESKKVTKLLHHTKDEYLGNNYWIINKNLKVTPNHPVYTNNGIKLLKSLKIGDMLTDDKLQSVRIDSIDIVNQKVEQYYNFEVKDNNNYFVENYLVSSI